MNFHATAWTIPDLKDLKDWNSPFPDPPDIIIVFALSFVSLLLACHIFRIVSEGHWEYRGTWVVVAVMIFLFLIGLTGLATMIQMIH